MSIESVGNGNRTYQGSSSVSEGVKVSTARTAAPVEQAPADMAGKMTSAMDTMNVSSSGKALQNINSTEQEEQQTRNSQIRSAVENINKNSSSTEAIFGIHDDTNRVTIKIIDKETKKVIKEFPPEKTLDMIAKVWEMAGLMVDEKR